MDRNSQDEDYIFFFFFIADARARPSGQYLLALVAARARELRSVTLNLLDGELGDRKHMILRIAITMVRNHQSWAHAPGEETTSKTDICRALRR